MRAIFISYRREDAEGEAGRLFDDLVEAFGEQSVFMDVAAIEPGRDFRKIIDDSVATCGVLLAIIGRHWLDAKDETGRRRLDNPSDFVRLETASALKRDIPVIPVLVHGARMPATEQLPENLQELAYRNGVELTGVRWRSDVQLLINALRPHVEKPDRQGAEPVLAGKGGTGIKPAPEPVPTPPAPLATAWWKRPAFLISAGLVIIAAVAYFLLRPGATVAVPDLNGVALADAVSRLQALNLAVGQKTAKEDATRDPDTVVGQTPAPGSRVKAGTAIDLVLSQRAPTVAVPDLSGVSLGDAVTKLQALQLRVGKQSYQEDGAKDPDTVLNQEPSAGAQVASGAAIDLVLSRQPQTVMVAVPQVVGMALQQAKQALAAQHLTPGAVTREATANQQPNTVLEAAPAPGESVPSGTSVALKVSKAPAQPSTRAASVTVPDLSGKPLAEARNEINGMGLSVGEVTEQESSNATAGSVLSQDPTAGQQVNNDTRVNLTVARQPAPLRPISIEANSIPSAISPGGQAQIAVWAKDANGSAIAGARVTISAGDGTFSESGGTSVTGTSTPNGVFFAYWRAPASAAQRYVLLVEVEKAGYQRSRGQVKVEINQQASNTPPYSQEIPSQGQRTSSAGQSSDTATKYPNFAGTWELFEATMNGSLENLDKRRITITQNGPRVHVFDQDLIVTSNGYLRYQRFAAGGSTGRSVATPAEADLIDTFTLIVKGDVLIFETSFHYKNSYGNHPPGTDYRVWKYRRVSR